MKTTFLVKTDNPQREESTMRRINAAISCTTVSRAKMGLRHPAPPGSRLYINGIQLSPSLLPVITLRAMSAPDAAPSLTVGFPPSWHFLA